MSKAVATSPSSQREQAYLGLRRLLILQQLSSGQRLREPEWADRLGVHRSALREAFARLEAEGWIERGPLTGYFVPQLTEQDLAEIMKLRIALECVAIDEICASAEPLALDEIERACDEFERLLRDGYALGVIEADRRFHEILIGMPRLRRLTDLYRRAPLPMIHHHTQEQSVWAQECGRTLAEHREIVDALRKRNADAAKRLLHRHLGNRPLLPICR